MLICLPPFLPFISPFVHPPTTRASSVADIRRQHDSQYHGGDAKVLQGPRARRPSGRAADGSGRHGAISEGGRRQMVSGASGQNRRRRRSQEGRRHFHRIRQHRTSFSAPGARLGCWGLRVRVYSVSLNVVRLTRKQKFRSNHGCVCVQTKPKECREYGAYFRWRLRIRYTMPKIFCSFYVYN